MKLYAISDIHLNYKANRDALVDLPLHLDDWLIIAGDIGESEAHFHYGFSILNQRFAKVIWVPGNHDLWTHHTDTGGLCGEDKYRKIISICREYGVITPEDPYVTWHLAEQSYLLVPLFLLYDYSFRPYDVPLENAVDWASKKGILCRDEHYIKPFPYPSIIDWCKSRLQYSKERLREIPNGVKLVLINHYPLIDHPLHRLTKIPQFSIWCGTKLTQKWHIQYPVEVVVYGHLHIRATDYYDGVRFEEVSLGYPRHWDQSKGINAYLREILPGS